MQIPDVFRGVINKGVSPVVGKTLLYRDYAVHIYPCGFGGYYVICEDGVNVRIAMERMTAEQIKEKFEIDIEYEHS